MDDSTRRLFLITLPELAACAVSLGEQRRIKRSSWEPAYLRLEREGELEKRAAALREITRACRLCPRQCGVNRLRDEKGVCDSGSRVRVYSAHPHFGEERPLVGRGGSGTIFFRRCNLLCEYCQNWEISHRGDGSVISDDQLAGLMLQMQSAGCHNVNLVTPTHWVPNIVNAIRSGALRGLRLPIVYNCSGYEPVEVLRLLDGIIDIYLPDCKYMDGEIAAKYSHGARDYPEITMAAIAEMHRQVGQLTVDDQGIALRGLMIRHLVLPRNLAGTDWFVRFVTERLGTSTYVKIMGQYRPEHRAGRYPELSRRVTGEEYRRAIEWARQAGLTNLDAG